MNSGAAIIVFRELFEASLIVSIVLGVTKQIPNRIRWVAAGIIFGVLGSVWVAASMNYLIGLFDGLGQDLLNTSILVLAALMLSWHIIWMSTHGKALASNISSVKHKIVAGEQPLYALTVIVGLAVLREGAEVVLFLNGMVASSNDVSGIILGSLTGLIAGLVISFIMYKGIVHIPAKYFFSSTTWLITLLAAGLISTAAGILEQVDLIPSIIPVVWDTNDILSQSSMLGQALQTLVGYNAAPSLMQLICYASTIVLITLARKLVAAHSQVQPEAKSA
ncbi:FTR1 family iron permease [Photobacterium sp. Hal280]|uniref:FTR1 family iron permease n=1 Tax=Photobacterium sp. Hal280 TaxID=3035163 RepID=UPI00301CAA33